jgi:hypothetical protein
VIQLPFWLILPSEGDISRSQQDGASLVFSSAEQMAAFFQADGHEQWSVKHITQASVNAAIDELEQRGFSAIHYFSGDSSGPQKLALSEVRQLLNLGKNGAS